MEMMIALEDNDIIHFGIKRKSGRYPWGSGKRPYQSGGGPPKNETKEQRESRKKETIRNPKSAESLLEFADELSYNELDSALKRLDLNVKLSDKVEKERNAGMERVKKSMQKVADFNAISKTGIDSLRNVKDVVDLVTTIKKMLKKDQQGQQEQEQRRR